MELIGWFLSQGSARNFSDTPKRGSGWLGSRDSNPDSMIQSHVSYRWTTSQPGY